MMVGRNLPPGLRTHSELFRVLTYKRTPRSQKLFDLHVAFLEPIEE